MKKIQAALAAILMVASLAAHAVGIVWSEGFESETIGSPISSFDVDPDNTTKCVGVGNGTDGVAPSVGSKAARCRYVSVSSYMTMKKSVASLYTDEMQFCFDGRFDANFAMTWTGGGSGSHTWRFFETGSPNYDWLIGFSSPGWWNSQISLSGSGATDLPGPGTGWRHYCMYVKLTTGVTKVFVDGTLYLNETVSYSGGKKWGSFYVASNWGEGTAVFDNVNDLYVDNFEMIADAGSGSCTGSMSLGTAACSGGGGDSTPPTVTITAPTSADTWSSCVTPIVVSGTASDDTAVSTVTWSNAAGGSGTAAGTTSWSFSPSLSSGSNAITVTASDAASNTGTDLITVTKVATCLPFRR